MSVGRGANPALMDRRRFVGLAATAGAAAMAGALLGGCAGEEEHASEGAATPGQEPAATAAPSPAAPETRATLVAVFSRTGHTLQVAERIHELVESDFFRIEPAATYPEDYDEMLETAQREQDDDARPALASVVENWDDYDTVYLGHPIWWAHVPQIMKSFVEQHDLAGKTVIPFATSGWVEHRRRAARPRGAVSGRDLRRRADARRGRRGRAARPRGRLARQREPAIAPCSDRLGDRRNRLPRGRRCDGLVLLRAAQACGNALAQRQTAPRNTEGPFSSYRLSVRTRLVSVFVSGW